MSYWYHEPWLLDKVVKAEHREMKLQFASAQSFASEASSRSGAMSLLRIACARLQRVLGRSYSHHRESQNRQTIQAQ